MSAQTSSTPFEKLPDDYLIDFRTEEGAGFMDTLGNVIIAPKYYIIDLFKDGLTTVSVKSNQHVGRNAYYGAYNLKGEMIIPIGPYHCRNLGYGIIEVDKGYTKAFHDRQGKEIISCDTCRLQYLYHQKRVVVHKSFDLNSQHQIEVYDLNKNLLFKCFGKQLRRLHNITTVGQIYNILPYYQIDISSKERLSHILKLDGSIHMDSVSLPIGFYDNMGVIGKKGVYALMDTLFNEIIPFSKSYESIARFGGSDEPRFMVKRNGKSGVVDQRGNFVLPINYEGNFSYHQDFLALYNFDEHKFYYLNDSGKQIGNPEWEMHETFVDELSGNKWFRVSTEDRKYGFVDHQGKLTVPMEYDFLSPALNFKSVYFKGEESGYIDIRNCHKTRINKEWLSELKDGVAIAGVPQYDASRKDFPCAQITYGIDKSFAMQYEYIDSSGKAIGSYTFDWAYPFHKGYARAMKHCQMIWLNKEIEPVAFEGLYLQSEFKDGLAIVVNKKRKYGLIDEKGKLIIDCKYDEIPQQEGEYVRYNVYHKTDKSKLQASKLMYPEIRDSTIRVRKGDSWGLLKTDGTVILNPEYSSIKLTDNKLMYRVSNKEGKSGLIQFDGTELLPVEYDYIGRYTPHGLFTIGKNGVWGKMHYTGKIYWPKGY